MGWLKTAALAGGLAVWYAFTSPSNEQLKNKAEYPLPVEISVVDTSLPFEVREAVSTSMSPNGKEEQTVKTEKIVKTDEINFSENFYIQTDRYRLVKDEDWKVSQLIGTVFSLPGKLLFWDWDYAAGQDEHRTRASLSMLENNKEIKDLTLRLNHNKALSDMVKMFSDEKIGERNNFLARVIMGIPLSLGDELWAEFSRGSYYNPLTETAVCYSNIEGITAHELGHHLDFQRFSSDWEYMFVRPWPPVMLYQEWQASKHAKEDLSEVDQFQFNRYLLPAFLTYILAGYGISKQLLQKSAMQNNGDERDLDKLKENEKPQISPLQTLRMFGTMNLSLYAGLGSYHLCGSVNSPDFLKYAGFAAGSIIASKVANVVLKRIVPYEHEDMD